MLNPLFFLTIALLACANIQACNFFGSRKFLLSRLWVFCLLVLLAKLYCCWPIFFHLSYLSCLFEFDESGILGPYRVMLQIPLGCFSSKLLYHFCLVSSVPEEGSFRSLFILLSSLFPLLTFSKLNCSSSLVLLCSDLYLIFRGVPLCLSICSCHL